ncbi:diguanylate cyclase/phosphodiesterase (GGDEF & EAL domains) with PAS/PAC sensor(s) [Rhodovulum sp. P5]|uniref:bifunctional diguanylate cyclase/phosphodiesterase n=1 Tax=Rhodovulum sp. P5 TaxID=1564506 RepID=UPI0009C2E796|nr:bifunctional diguanylate cyclase/phosphodiesterase [Rhodovulum sp. P5]ARE39344.1 diguanylate cyclase/phosphodiesterase (GGDEF & EAL domains) with PAS/PAC sensor(s) [Rhodovulum sp. P5]
MDGTLCNVGSLLDPTTGFLTRSDFVACLQRRVARRGAVGFGLILLNLARFDEVNDSFGPLKADELLTKAARRIEGAARDAHAIGRISGNEFAILVDRDDGFTGTIKRLQDLFSSPFMLCGRELRLGIHVGSVQGTSDLATGLDMLHLAGIALSAAKRTGPGHLCYAPEMKTAAASVFTIENDLRDALLEQGNIVPDPLRAARLFPVFQPKVDLATGRIKGVEVLCRMLADSGGVISPTLFLPIAERAGLMDALTLWLLRVTIRTLAELPKDVSAAINIPPCQLSRHEWLSLQIRDLLGDGNIAPERLELEITEHVLGSPIDDGVKALSKLGLKIWVDDFGTGEASLSRLVTLPFTGVKLDKSIVDTMQPDRPGDAERLIGAIEAIAFALSLETVAEGIEAAWQAERIESMGVDFGQGYHFAAPMELGPLQDVLETQQRSVGA